VFPFPHRLELDIRLAGDALTIVTTLEATGDHEVPLAWGWHPWLSLPGVPRAEWELSLPARTAVVLDERHLPTGEREDAPAERAPLADRVLDVHSAVAPDARFALTGGGREIAVEWAEGYRYAQVFAPSVLDVACLEPMMAPVAALSTGEHLDVANPGERASATFRVRVT
jgi:galactose mutarotase-like enzyme